MDRMIKNELMEKSIGLIISKFQRRRDREGKKIEARMNRIETIEMIQMIKPDHIGSISELE